MSWLLKIGHRLTGIHFDISYWKFYYLEQFLVTHGVLSGETEHLETEYERVLSELEVHPKRKYRLFGKPIEVNADYNTYAIFDSISEYRDFEALDNRGKGLWLARIEVKRITEILQRNDAYAREERETARREAESKAKRNKPKRK